MRTIFLLLVVVTTLVHCKQFDAIVQTVAGNGTNGNKGTIATQASIGFAKTLFIDAEKNLLYICASSESRMVNISNEKITNFFHVRFNMVQDRVTKFLYFVNNREQVVMVQNTSTSVPVVVAGTGETGFAGDGQAATSAKFRQPSAVALDSQRRLLFVLDQDNHRVRVINMTSGIISTIAGNGGIGEPVSGPALQIFVRAFSIRYEEQHNILFVFSGSAISYLNMTSMYMTAVPIKGVYEAQFVANSLLIVQNNHIMTFDIFETANLTKIIAGSGQVKFDGDEKSALETGMSPVGIAFDASRSVLYVADSSNFRVRKLLFTCNTGFRHCICGNGQSGSGSQCFDCPLGSYSITNVKTNSASCILCPVGTYCNDPRAASLQFCKPCLPGTTNAKLGASTCQNCAAGSYSEQMATTECDLCPKGTFSNVEGANSAYMCSTCASGTFAANRGSTSCVACEAGYFATGGSIACERCENGTISGTSAAKCDTCKAGTESNFTHCNPCARNWYNSKEGNKCVECSYGTSDIGSTDCKNDRLQDAVLIGIILGTTLPLVSCCIIIVLITGCAMYRTIKSKRMSDEELLQSLLGDEMKEHSFNLKCDMPLIPFEKLTNLNELASGGSGALVLKAKWEQKDVVIKLFKMNDEAAQEFQHETSVLAQLRDKNIVYFYGVSVCSQRVGIVTEFCPYGSLRSYLTRNKISWSKKLRIHLESAQGLAYLHSVNIIHRDIKLDNILLDADEHAKLTDFGISKSVSENQVQHTRQVGTSYYMAPEVILSGLYNVKCDIFSFAIVMFEVMTENLNPFAHISNVEVRIANDANFRPIIPATYMEDLLYYDFLNLMRACWSASPDQRPDANQLCSELLKIHQSYKP